MTAPLVVRKCAHGKIDRHRSMVVESSAQTVVGLVQSQIFAAVQLPCPHDRPLSHLGIDAPVTPFVGIGQGRAPDRLAEPHVIELRRVDRKAGLNVAQALAQGQLGDGHGPVLLGAGEHPNPAVAIVAGDDPDKRRPRQEIHQLSEQVLAGVHGRLRGKTPQSAPSNSNRHHPFSTPNPSGGCGTGDAVECGARRHCRHRGEDRRA